MSSLFRSRRLGRRRAAFSPARCRSPPRLLGTSELRPSRSALALAAQTSRRLRACALRSRAS
eukprot:4808664-Prymnesium_polylepis.1